MKTDSQMIFELEQIKNFIDNIDICDDEKNHKLLREVCSSKDNIANFRNAGFSSSHAKDVYIVVGGIAVGKSTVASNFIKYFNLYGLPFVSSNILYNIQYEKKEYNEKDYDCIRSVVCNILEECKRLKLSFVWETVLSKSQKISFIENCKKSGYAIHCFFIGLDNVDIALKRSKTRKVNNYEVSEAFIRDRYSKSMDSFKWIYENVDDLVVIDNTDIPQVVLLKNHNRVQICDNTHAWVHTLLNEI